MLESEEQVDRVGDALVGKGNVSSFFLITVPLFYEITIRYSLRTAMFVTLTVGVFIVLVLWLQFKLVAKSKFNSYANLLAAMLVSYGGMLYFLGAPLSAFTFIGVMPAGFMAYAYGRKGRALGHLLVLNIIAWTYILATMPGSFTWENFSHLVSYLALVALMIEFVAVNVELSKQELADITKSDRKIRAEHQRLLSLINNIGDAVVGTDYDGVIQTYNGATLDLLDTNVSITGKKLSEIVNLIDMEGLSLDLIAEARKAGRNIRRNDVRLRYGPDDVANLYVNVTPIKVGYGHQSERGFTLIMRDITKEKSLEEERDEFVSVVSHELRTPVTITEGKLSNALLILDKPDTDMAKLHNSLGQAHDQIVYLSNMVNDLSSLARAERAEAQLELESVDPTIMVEEISNTYEIQAREKGLDFVKIIDNRPLPRLYTSRLYLQEVLQNFVTNALKYTKQGKVTLKVEPDQPGKVKFSVTDSGIGISKSDQKHLFEKFYRSEDYRTRESSGTGLGLYVTMKLIHKLQGQVNVESQINKGSTFSLVVGSLEDKSHRAKKPAA